MAATVVTAASSPPVKEMFAVCTSCRIEHATDEHDDEGSFSCSRCNARHDGTCNTFVCDGCERTYCQGCPEGMKIGCKFTSGHWACSPLCATTLESKGEVKASSPALAEEFDHVADGGGRSPEPSHVLVATCGCGHGDVAYFGISCDRFHESQCTDCKNWYFAECQSAGWRSIRDSFKDGVCGWCQEVKAARESLVDEARVAHLSAHGLPSALGSLVKGFL